MDRHSLLPCLARRWDRADQDEAAEVYQKAFTIFYFNIRDGKLTELSASLETYLFGIGKRVKTSKNLWPSFIFIIPQ